MRGGRTREGPMMKSQRRFESMLGVLLLLMACLVTAVAQDSLRQPHGEWSRHGGAAVGDCQRTADQPGGQGGAKRRFGSCAGGAQYWRYSTRAGLLGGQQPRTNAVPPRRGLQRQYGDPRHPAASAANHAGAAERPSAGEFAERERAAEPELRRRGRQQLNPLRAAATNRQFR